MAFHLSFNQMESSIHASRYYQVLVPILIPVILSPPISALCHHPWRRTEKVHPVQQHYTFFRQPIFLTTSIFDGGLASWVVGLPGANGSSTMAVSQFNCSLKCSVNELMCRQTTWFPVASASNRLIKMVTISDSCSRLHFHRHVFVVISGVCMSPYKCYPESRICKHPGGKYTYRFWNLRWLGVRCDRCRLGWFAPTFCSDSAHFLVTIIITNVTVTSCSCKSFSHVIVSVIPLQSSWSKQTRIQALSYCSLSRCSFRVVVVIYETLWPGRWMAASWLN